MSTEFRIHTEEKQRKEMGSCNRWMRTESPESPDSEGFDSSQSTAHLKKRSETALEARRAREGQGRLYLSC